MFVPSTVDQFVNGRQFGLSPVGGHLLSNYTFPSTSYRSRKLFSEKPQYLWNKSKNSLSLYYTWQTIFITSTHSIYYKIYSTKMYWNIKLFRCYFLYINEKCQAGLKKGKRLNEIRLPSRLRNKHFTRKTNSACTGTATTRKPEKSTWRKTKSGTCSGKITREKLFHGSRVFTTQSAKTKRFDSDKAFV